MLLVDTYLIAKSNTNTKKHTTNNEHCNILSKTIKKSSNKKGQTTNKHRHLSTISPSNN